MDLDDLRGVQANERGTDSLQSLPDSFYRDVVDYIQGLRAERDRAAERADDPFGSEEVRRLTDEIETAAEVAEAIYDRRVGKVVKRASLAAAGMPTDEEGLTDEEVQLFADLVEQIESHRGAVLSAFAGDESTDGVRESPPETARKDPEPAPEPPPDGDPTGAAFDASAAMGGDATPDGRTDEEGTPAERPTDDPSTADSEGIGRTTVRITRDVGEIMGVDEHVYELAADDVVRLPEANAEPLIDRDAASRIE